HQWGRSWWPLVGGARDSTVTADACCSESTSPMASVVDGTASLMATSAGPPVAQWRRAVDLQRDPLGDLAADRDHLRRRAGAHDGGHCGGPDLDDDCERLGGPGTRPAADVGAAGVRD